MGWFSARNLLAAAAAPFTAGTSLALMENGDGDSIIGDITGANSAKKANKQNIDLARETNNTSINLANTAHQREIKDLEAAGLNPVLSAMGGSGAATPNLTTAQVQNTQPGGLMTQASTAANVVGALSQAKAASAAANLSNQQAINTATDTEYMPAMKKAEIAAQYANAGNAKAQADYTNVMKDVDAEMKKAETTGIKWENQINQELGTSKNENSAYRAFKNVVRSVFDTKYNPLKGIK